MAAWAAGSIDTVVGYVKLGSTREVLSMRDLRRRDSPGASLRSDREGRAGAVFIAAGLRGLRTDANVGREDSGRADLLALHAHWPWNSGSCGMTNLLPPHGQALVDRVRELGLPQPSTQYWYGEIRQPVAVSWHGAGIFLQITTTTEDTEWITVEGGVSETGKVNLNQIPFPQSLRSALRRIRDAK